MKYLFQHCLTLYSTGWFWQLLYRIVLHMNSKVTGPRSVVRFLIKCTFLCRTLIFLSLISMWSRSSVSSELSLFLSWVVWRACWVFFSMVLFFSSSRCRNSSTWRSIPEECCCKPKHTGTAHIFWFLHWENYSVVLLKQGVALHLPFMEFITPDNTKKFHLL